MINIRDLNLRSYAVIGMLVLWASLTFSIALTEIAFVCALVCWIGWHILLKKGICQNASAGGKIDRAFWAPLVLFFMFVLVSYFTSEYPKQSLQGLYKIAKPLLAFVMAIELFGDAKSQKKFRGIFLATFLLVVIDCSIQYAFGKDLLRGFAAEQSRAGLRLIGPFGNFAKMATYLVLVIPVFAMRFWSDFIQPDQRKGSFFSLALAVSGLVLLYLTRCRGPVVALVLSFGILFIYKRWFKALGITLVLCFALLAAMPHNVLIHQDALGREQSMGERQVLWRRAFDVILAKPVFGTGINTYDKSHAKYDTLQQKKYMPISGTSYAVRQNPNGSVSFLGGNGIFTSDEKQKVICMAGKDYNVHRDAMGRYSIWNDYVARGYYVHNGYLQLAAEIGLPGIFCFLWFLFMFFRKVLGGLGAVRNSPEEYALLGILTGLLAFLLYATCDNNLQSPPSLMFFWFSAGILLARHGQLWSNTLPKAP
jgi:O-antigen ligase